MVRLLKNCSTNQKALVLLLCAILLFFTLLSIQKKSITWDELCYIGAGDYILKTRDFKYNALLYHPPLSFYINSIFISFLKFDPSVYEKADCWEFGKAIAFHSGYDYRFVTLISRLPIILLSVILAFLVFKWANELYGTKSGIIALVLYTFNTAILAFGGLALTDFVATFFIFATLYSFWLYTKTETKKSIAITGICLGLALMSKATAIILFPAIFIMILFYKKKKTIEALSKFIVVLLIAAAVMFVGYGFRFDSLNNSLDSHYYLRAHEEISKLSPIPKKLLEFGFNIPLPFPTYFVELGSVFYYSNIGVASFINGTVTEQAVWYLPLAVLLFKTQLSLLILFGIALFYQRKSKKKELILLLPIILIFLLFMLNNRTSGIRHLLPIYPFMFVYSSRLFQSEQKNTFLTFKVILLLHYIASSLIIAPSYLAYYNEFAGGPQNGYKIVVGSNIDLGQDLPGLKDYMDKNSISKIKLSYFGSVDPKEYNISYEYLASPYFQYWDPDYKPFVTLKDRKEDCSEKKGFIAISVNNLQNVHLLNKTCFDWLKKHEPVAKVGYSIFVYNLS